MDLDRAKKIFILDYDDTNPNTVLVSRPNGNRFISEFDISNYNSRILNRPCFVKWVYGVVETKFVKDGTTNSDQTMFLCVNTNIVSINSLNTFTGGLSELLFQVDMPQVVEFTNPTQTAGYNFNHSGEGFFCPALPPKLVVTKYTTCNPKDVTLNDLDTRFRLQIEFLD